MIVGVAMIGNKIRVFFAINNKNMSVIAGSFYTGLIIVPCLIVGGIAPTFTFWPT